MEREKKNTKNKMKLNSGGVSAENVLLIKYFYGDT